MRKKIGGLALGAMLVALSFRADAQQAKKIPRIGILSLGSGNSLGLARRGTDAFQQALHELGWLDGKNIVLEYRWANENEARLFELAAELVRINVDILLVTTPRAANAARKLRKTIPIVTVIPGPSQNGLVQSLSQPGGNVTGLSRMSPELSGKRLELLKEIVPKISRVAVLENVDDVEPIKEIKAVARSLGVQIEVLNVKKPKKSRMPSQRR